MSEEISFSINPGDDYPMEKLSDENSAEAKAFHSKNAKKNTNSGERNAVSKNNK